MVIEYIVLLVAGGLSSLTTFILHVKFNQGTVRASALVGVLAGVFVLLFPNLLSVYLIENLPLVCFGASFTGMVSSNVLSNYVLVALSGVVFTIIFFNASSFFNGFGGGLGSAACIALLVTLSIPILKKKGRLSNGFLILKKQMKRKIRKKK
ncbi:hypothetical protein BZARG_1475 [Bizionia argentinensis JUB59]|uniref:Uncharacterized protein n=1 Tax=Bizionia argentinensis JUB59 TaxID=1046627 RepID=G2EC51_9FLAO|nr:hypothetical protein [Bizionia argentinensis]EGV44032.1 hypothetical protein BZARG_1475 [Bizionia argentinensis JUB59]